MQGHGKFERPVATEKVNTTPTNFLDLEQAGLLLLRHAEPQEVVLPGDDQDEQLGRAWPCDEEEHFWREVSETDARADASSAQSGCPPGPDGGSGLPGPEETERAKLLLVSGPSTGSLPWTVCAPEIERAIHELLSTLGRTPTDAEIAKELRLSVDRYHEALILLRDIESEIAIRDRRRRDVRTSAESNVLSIRMGDPVFCCLRSQIATLFSNAIKMLPEQERLVVTLRYCEDCSDLTICLALNIEESTLTRLSASAFLHVRARIFGSRDLDHVVTGDCVRPATATRRLRTDQTGPEAHIYMSGHQNGWLPTGNPWEAGASEVRYCHFTRSYFFIEEDGAIMPVQRMERFELSIEQSGSLGVHL